MYLYTGLSILRLIEALKFEFQGLVDFTVKLWQYG